MNCNEKRNKKMKHSSDSPNIERGLIRVIKIGEIPQFLFFYINVQKEPCGLLFQCVATNKSRIIIIMSLFNEDNIFSKYTNLTYGPLKSKNTNSA